MKNLIFEALAFESGGEPSPSMQNMKNPKQVRDVYLKNAFISLASVKAHNKNQRFTDVAFVVNFKLGKEWRKRFEEEKILVWECPFECFKMPLSVTYALSYYKICAFQYVLVQHHYDNYCFIDCDTFGVSSFEDIWEEVKNAFLVIPNESCLSAGVRREINDIYNRIYRDGRKIPHISSGFIAGTKNDLEIVLQKCREAYGMIMEKGDIMPQAGDEIIWSLALGKTNLKVYSPKAYVLLANIGFREYWVDKVNYADPDIILWHLPAEKRYALIWAYEYYEKHRKLPKLRLMAKACRIRRIYNRFNLLSPIVLLKDPTVFLRNMEKLKKYGQRKR